MDVLSVFKFYTIIDDLGQYCDKDTVHKQPILNKWVYFPRETEKMPRDKYSGSEIGKVVEWLENNVHRVDELNKNRKFRVIEIEV